MAPSWMLSSYSAHTLEGYVGHGLSQAELDYVFGSSRSYELTRSSHSQTKTQFPDASSALVFSDYNSLVAALNAHMPAGVKAVMYDPENWSFTPAAQQQNPAHYEQLAAEVAHAHGLELIAAPAVNLATESGGGQSTSKYDQYIANSYAAAAAKYADVYEIQAQGLEGNTAEYSQFLAKAIAQAKAANPDITIFAGLSTSADGSAVTSQQLFQDVKATDNEVAGYWLNIAGPSPYSPNVHESNPGVAVGLLNDLWLAART